MSTPCASTELDSGVVSSAISSSSSSELITFDFLFDFNTMRDFLRGGGGFGFTVRIFFVLSGFNGLLLNSRVTKVLLKIELKQTVFH